MLLFFVYGLAFFALGLTLVIRQPPSVIANYRNSHYLLGSFALVHSIAEWLLMGQIALNGNSEFPFAKWAIIFGGLSFVLLTFAAREASRSLASWLGNWLHWFAVCISLAWGCVLLLVLMGQHTTPDYLDLVGRWLLGGPAGLLIGVSYIVLSHRPAIELGASSHDSQRQINISMRALRLGGVLIALYGLSTFFGAYADIFPFSIINAGTFADVTGVSTPSVRTVLTLGMLASFLWFVSGFAAWERREMEKMIEDRTQEITRANQEISMALRQLEEANDAKSAFLASMSHELRTPLNAILGFSDALTGRYFGPQGEDKYAEYAGYIRSSAEHLLSLINDLLDISMIEAGQHQLTIEDIDICKLLDECALQVEMRMSERNVTLTVHHNVDQPIIRADSRALRQIALNLLSNSAKFTQEGGEVHLSTDGMGGMLRLVVEDTGVGMSQKQIDGAIDPFVRSSRDPHVAEKGWGLGLAITKSLIDLHEGSLSIESKVGVGTKVIVSLPISGPDIDPH